MFIFMMNLLVNLTFEFTGLRGFLRRTGGMIC